MPSLVGALLVRLSEGRCITDGGRVAAVGMASNQDEQMDTPRRQADVLRQQLNRMVCTASAERTPLVFASSSSSRWLRAIIVLFALLVVELVLAPVTVTQAQPVAQPIAASGTFELLGPPEVLSSQTVGGTTFITQRTQYRLTGTFTGTAVFEEHLIILPTGAVVAWSEGTFTGTVAGRSGTVRVLTASTGDTTALRGQFVVHSGTGGLANLYGQGTFEASPQTGTGTYRAVLQFVP